MVRNCNIKMVCLYQLCFFYEYNNTIEAAGQMFVAICIEDKSVRLYFCISQKCFNYSVH